MTKCDQKTSGDNFFFNFMRIREGLLSCPLLGQLGGTPSRHQTPRKGAGVSLNEYHGLELIWMDFDSWTS